jgi:hypothetical protein
MDVCLEDVIFMIYFIFISPVGVCVYSIFGASGSGWVVILGLLESPGYEDHFGGNFSRFGAVLTELWLFCGVFVVMIMIFLSFKPALTHHARNAPLPKK